MNVSAAPLGVKAKKKREKKCCPARDGNVRLVCGTLLPGTGPCRLASRSIKNFATRLKGLPVPSRQGSPGIFSPFYKVFPKCILLWLASSGSLVIIKRGVATKPQKKKSLHAVVVAMKQHQEPLPRRAPVCHFRPAGSTSPAPGGPWPHVAEASRAGSHDKERERPR